MRFEPTANQGYEEVELQVKLNHNISEVFEVIERLNLVT